MKTRLFSLTFQLCSVVWAEEVWRGEPQHSFSVPPCLQEQSSFIREVLLGEVGTVFFQEFPGATPPMTSDPSHANDNEASTQTFSPV